MAKTCEPTILRIPLVAAEVCGKCHCRSGWGTSLDVVITVEIALLFNRSYSATDTMAGHKAILLASLFILLATSAVMAQGT